MSDDRNSTARAPIRFAAEGSAANHGDDPDFVNFPEDGEEENLEIASPTARQRNATEKKAKGFNRTVVVAGISMVLLMLLLGGLFLYMKQKRVVQEEDLATRPQPAYVQDDSRAMGYATPVQTSSQTPGGGAQPLQNQAAGQDATVQSAPPSVQSVTLAPSMQPAASTGADVGRTEAKIVEITERMGRIESSIATLVPIVERLVQLDKARAAQPVAPKALEKPEAKEAKEKPAAAVRAAVEAKPVAKAAPLPKPASGKTTKAAKSDESASETSPVNAFDTKLYSVNSVIGNRAWIVRVGSDGSETEYSVAAGEVLEGTGRVVAAVDGKLKRVCFDNGQCVVKR